MNSSFVHLAALVLLLPACAHDRAQEPAGSPPPMAGSALPSPPLPPPPTPIPSPAPSLPTSVASADGTPDEWQSSCSKVIDCGVCLNHVPCHWCATEERCVGPHTMCTGLRVEQSGACMTAPLEVAKQRYPSLAGQLARYEVEREAKDADLSGENRESFFLNSGDCFAILAEPLPGNDTDVHLGYKLSIRGIARPGDRVAPPEPNTGGRAGSVELSPEFCPWEHQPLAIWNDRPRSTKGAVRLRLLRRTHPDPARLERERPRSAVPSHYGSCSSMECGEDCRSELRACELDCFRYGSHEPTQAQICKNTCRQLARACERGCAVPCP